MSENSTIKYEVIDNIGIIKGVNPPVNALSYSVRSGLIHAVDNLNSNELVKAIVFNFFECYLCLLLVRVPVKIYYACNRH